jgi:hypothetical protein
VIVLIACAAKKLAHAAPAKDLYTSQLFRLSYSYAVGLKPDAIYILSAKHGLVSENTVIEPYNVTLNTMSASAIRAWSDAVLDSLRGIADLTTDEVVVLAGDRYRKYLMAHLPNAQVPLEGLRIGEQLQFLVRNGHT